MVCYAKDIKRRELWTGESNEGVWKIVDSEALLFYIYIYIYMSWFQVTPSVTICNVTLPNYFL